MASSKRRPGRQPEGPLRLGRDHGAARPDLVEEAAEGPGRLTRRPRQVGCPRSTGLGQVAELARNLFGFLGSAYTCRIPARDLSNGEGLSLTARRFAKQAGREIESHIIGS